MCSCDCCDPADPSSTPILAARLVNVPKPMSPPMLRPLESVMAAPADLIGQYGVLVAAQSGQWEKNLLMLRCVKAWRDFNSRSVRCRQYPALAHPQLSIYAARAPGSQPPLPNPIRRVLSSCLSGSQPSTARCLCVQASEALLLGPAVSPCRWPAPPLPPTAVCRCRPPPCTTCCSRPPPSLPPCLPWWRCRGARR